ncbi:discoidin domain-containing protein [Lacisediminihabitans changchengi]|uniref:glucan endo-1,3-beta-D-glucosidase n=1 Tax=Lacisediminihabitans changchengi TaxID=2787634 RepID=A0A934W5L8_9MICO|nr:discoidin domain-containing protein [Lacisediminihabitans changchengi]MBK4348660.1 discoidin domain-containing protein [Lacisediminihabitans changchengi]
MTLSAALLAVPVCGFGGVSAAQAAERTAPAPSTSSSIAGATTPQKAPVEPGPGADGVQVGAGSYAPTPPNTITDSADVQNTLNQHLYIDPSQAGKPVPTNQWWTDLVVSKYSGDMWANPFVSSNSANGTTLTYPTTWNADGTQMKLDDGITVGGKVAATLDPSDDLITDFEHGIPSGWTATGTAFASTANSTPKGQGTVSGWLDDRFLDSWTDDGGDGATGTLTSPDFTIDKTSLSFMIAGGKDLAKEALQVVVDGSVVASATGTQSEQLQWANLDLTPWQGKRAQLRVVDGLNAGWAHIELDQIVLTNVPAGIAQRFSTSFTAAEADALRWGDWNVSWRMPQTGAPGQYMDVTSVQGVPYEWFEYTGETPRITTQATATVTDGDGKAISFPFTGDRFEIRQNGHVFGVHAPAETTFTRSGTTIDASPGTKYIVLSAVPKTGLSLDQLHKYAFAVPRNTTMDYSYDAAKGTVDETWKIDTDALQGSNHDTIQGWIKHQYKDSDNSLSFTGATYATPRGTMKTTIGHSGWNLSYAFSGMTPIGGTPDASADNGDFATVMRKYLSDYASRTTYGGDTYWGGKDLEQLAEYMMVARQIGDTEQEQKLQDTLEGALTDWYTYTTGESAHFFARYPTWKALIGFGDSYGSAQFNDNHFHYGYFAVATALLGQVDPTWIAKYEAMATLVVKEYANWDRDSTEFPHLRTFGVWEGHSNAGGVSSPGGNNQESSSEAIQSEAGLFLLGSVLGDKQMQATGAMEYVNERAAVREYYQNAAGNPASSSYDGDGAFPAAYGHGQAGILFDSGQAEATYFSGDPAWIYGIQWMPTAPWFDYFGWDPKFSKAIMQQMMKARPEIVGNDGVKGGNIGHIQMLTKKWWGVGTYGADPITENRDDAIRELEDAIRATERNHPGYVTARTANNPLYDAATDTLYVSVDASGAVVFPEKYWTPTTLPASLTPIKLTGAEADKQPTDWAIPSPLLGFLSTNYQADPVTTARLYSADLSNYTPGKDTAQAAAVFSDMGDALGEVVLGYLAQYDPSTYADIHAALWNAKDPAVTGQSMAGMVYYQGMSNLAVGTEVTTRHTSDPLSQVFRDAAGKYTYVLDNPDAVQHSYDVYDGDTVIGQIAVPAKTQISSHLDAHLTRVVVSTVGSPKTIAPKSTTRFDVVGYDQYGATFPTRGLVWSASAGSISADGQFVAPAATDTVTVTAAIGGVKDSYSFRVDRSPTLTSLTVTPGFDRVVAGTPVTFSAAGRDQYGDVAALPGDVTWSYTGPGAVGPDGTLVTTGPGSGYVVATIGGIEGSSVASSVATIPDAALHAVATASSTRGASVKAVIDGDTQTRWESEWGIDAVDVTLDLGRETDISTVGIRWEDAAAAKYDLQVADSADGPWRTVREVTKAAPTPDSLDVDATGRFVRMHGLSRLRSQYGYSIWDFQVFGTPAESAITPTAVLLAPRATSVLAGDTAALNAYAFDDAGNGGAVAPADTVWAITGGGTVSAKGVVTAAAKAGVTSTVTATVGGTASTATVTTVANGDASTPATPSPSRNIAVGKPVTTSSIERGGLAGEQAVDGDTDTRWSSAPVEGQWIAVDLGAVLPIDAVQFDWEAAYAKGYQIQVRNTETAEWRTVATVTGSTGGTDRTALDGVSARYVRMLGGERSSPYGYSLYEFEVYSTQGAPSPDLAHKHPVESSSDESGSFPAKNAVDGDAGSRWASGHTDGEWLDVDLGAVTPVHSATLNWEGAYGSAYLIQGRTSPFSTWTTVATVSNGDGGTDSVALSGDWRYIRMQGVTRATPYGYSLYSIEIH